MQNIFQRLLGLDQACTQAPTLKGFPQQNLLKHKHENRTNPGWLENRRIAMLYEERKPHLNYDLGEKKKE